MLKTRRSKIAIVAVMIFSMIAMYGAIPTVEAASFTSTKATLSDSDLGVIATTTVVIDMGDANYLESGEYIRVAFDPTGNAFTLATPVVTCPSDSNASTSASAADEVVDCVATGFVEATSSQTIVIGNITNPGSENSAGYGITITTYQSNGTEIESSDVRVYIINDIEVSATVDASLTFSVAGVTAYSGSVNGTTTEITSTPTAIQFGTLSISSTTVAAQDLTVSTNAKSGYVVTVQQDHELTSGAGANINSFNNAPTSQGSTTATAWAIPAGSLGVDRTYGHMGITSDDTTYFSTNDYWAGLNGTDALAVMAHNGPVNGTGTGVGTTRVGYAVEITALQEAGDYTANLTYVCTPTY